MAKIICNRENRYNVYDTISDGFVFGKSIGLIELHAYFYNRDGMPGSRALKDRVERARNNGHSLYNEAEALDQFLSANRAGEYGTHLSYEECIKRFLS